MRILCTGWGPMYSDPRRRSSGLRYMSLKPLSDISGSRLQVDWTSTHPENKSTIWTMGLHPVEWVPPGLISRAKETEREQEIGATDSNSESDPDKGILWSARLVSNETIMERFIIDRKAPIGMGRYGKVYQVFTQLLNLPELTCLGHRPLAKRFGSTPSKTPSLTFRNAP
jgi:hypothetical protein